jgi:hypothetical protein
MAERAEPGTRSPTGLAAPPIRFGRSFFAWGAGAYLLVVAYFVVRAAATTDGAVVYAIDDAAIHQSIADNLVHHGTWGVVPGHFQSASSSPAWTVLLAGWAGLAGLLGSTRLDTLASLGPLVLNTCGALMTIAVLGANQRVLAPSRRRPLDALAVVALCVVVLFLPAATALGMEHTLHTAVVLGAVVTFTRAAGGARRWGPPWLPFALLGLATLLRFETVFVAAGLVAAELARLLPGWRSPGRELTGPGQLRRAGLVAAASGVPLAVFAVANRAMGQGWLPNSVLSKGQTTSGEGNLDWESVLGRLTQDPVLAVGVLAVAVVLVLDWRRPRPSMFAAIVVVVAAAGHVVFAQIGWYDRYQVYLITLVVFALLTAAGDHLPADRRPPARSAVVPVLVALALLVSGTKVELTGDVPIAIADTYRQRYQAALFLERSYDGLPVATSELGYISLAHDGPLTDMLGLGDHAVLEERLATGQHPPATYWSELARERGFDVVVTLPIVLVLANPPEWTLVAELRLERTPAAGLDPTLQFWATSPQAIGPLADQLEAFAPQLPPGASLVVQPEIREQDRSPGTG